MVSRKGEDCAHSQLSGQSVRATGIATKETPKDTRSRLIEPIVASWAGAK
jgi:hypothetical protein